jgi:hypothetical protein
LESFFAQVKRGGLGEGIVLVGAKEQDADGAGKRFGIRGCGEGDGDFAAFFADGGGGGGDGSGEVGGGGY